jgi:hypothetical protein
VLTTAIQQLWEDAISIGGISILPQVFLCPWKL